MADWLSGAGTGATAGATAGGVPGALIGGAAGLVLGGLSDMWKSSRKKDARKDVNSWKAEAEKILEDNFNNSARLSGEGDVATYQKLRDSYNPNDYVLSDDVINAFDKSRYNVEDYLNPNAEAIRQNVLKALQHTAAGSAMGHSSGAAASIMQGVMEKDEQLLKDAREQMNQERQFDYGMYTDFIRNKQQQLQALQQGNQAQMDALRGDIQFDQQNKDNYVSNLLSLGNSVAQTKAQLV